MGDQYDVRKRTKAKLPKGVVLFVLLVVNER